MYKGVMGADHWEETAANDPTVWTDIRAGSEMTSKSFIPGGGGGALTFEKGRGVRPQNLKPYP